MADARRVLAMARQMDQLGYRSVWLSENRVLDAISMSGAIAATTDLEVGTGIVPVFSRTPAVLAMTAASISRLSGGKPMHLGIGAGGQVTVERWHGVPFQDTVATTEETIDIVKQALAGEKTDVDGSTRRSHGFSIAEGPDFAAYVYVGGMGPKMLDLAARKADGLIVTWLSPRILTDFSKRFAESVVDAGRDPQQVQLVPRAYVAVCDDPAAAREGVRRELVEYLISPPYGKYFSSVGFGEEVAAARAGYEARNRQQAVAGVSDALVDEVLICGRTPDEIAEPLRAYFASGADHVMVQPVPSERGGDPEQTISAVAEALR